MGVVLHNCLVCNIINHCTLFPLHLPLINLDLRLSRGPDPEQYLFGGRRKGGVRKPTVYRFPKFPLNKYMHSCLGQWSATHLRQGFLKYINCRFTNPPFEVLPILWVGSTACCERGCGARAVPGQKCIDPKP